MPLNNFVISPLAQSDLNAIQHYIAQDSSYAAKRIVTEIFNTLRNLSEDPFIGHKREDLTNKSVRFFSVRHYMIIYDPESKPINIFRVLSSYRDIQTLLN